MLALSPCVLALHMARPLLPVYPSTLRTQPPNCVEVYVEPPNPHHVIEQLDQTDQEVAAEAERVPMIFWESQSAARARKANPSARKMGRSSKDRSRDKGKSLLEEQQEQQVEVAAGGRPIMQQQQQAAKSKAKAEHTHKHGTPQHKGGAGVESGRHGASYGWSYHDATPLDAGGGPLTLAAKRKIFWASQMTPTKTKEKEEGKEEGKEKGKPGDRISHISHISHISRVSSWYRGDTLATLLTIAIPTHYGYTY